GRHLFGDAAHFSSHGRYTLAPLSRGDPACVAVADAPGVRNARVVEMYLTWPNSAYDEVEVRRASDVLLALGQRGAVLPEGTRVNAVVPGGVPQRGSGRLRRCLPGRRAGN